MLSIPFHRPSIGDEEINEVVDCLRSGWLTTGPKTKQFEAEFARYAGLAHAVAVNSCTAALHLALEAIGLARGDAVLVPTMTFAATAEVVRYFDARPLLVDCRAEDLCLDVDDAVRQLERASAAGHRVKAVILVHYGGQVGDIFRLLEMARSYKLHLIEDAAHCCPAYYRASEGSPWRGVGQDSAISCFSFYANKAITTGEGGMVCTSDKEYAERMRIMSLHGISRDAWKRFTAEGSWYYEITAPGYKYNLTDIAAAIGIHQLRKADLLHQRRTERANLYTELLDGVEELTLPRAAADRIHSWHLYPIRLNLRGLNIDRAGVITELKNAGIGTSVHWMPLHLHPYYRDTWGYAPSDCPRAASIYPELISLPLFPDMTLGEVEHVCATLIDVLARASKLTAGVELPGAIPANLPA